MRHKVGLVQTTEPVTLMRTRAKTVAPSAIDFVLGANVRRKINRNEKERPQQALESGLGISHGERMAHPTFPYWRRSTTPSTEHTS